MVKLGRELNSLVLLGLLTLISSASLTINLDQTSPTQISSSDQSDETTEPSFSMSLANYYNLMYSGQVYIGSSNQPLNLIFDTGALWILVSRDKMGTSISLTECSPSAVCDDDDDEQTTTYSYLTESETIDGYIINETIVLNGNVVQINQTLLLSMTPEASESLYADGVCGLSLQNGNQPTLLDNLKSANIINQRIFGLYLSDNMEGYGETSSEIMFGGYNPNYFVGNFTNISVIPSSSYWQICLDRMYLASDNQTAKVQIRAGTAIIATGINNILMPSNDFAAFVTSLTENYQLGCLFDPDKDLVCNCSNGDISMFPDLYFVFASQIMSVPPSMYLEINEDSCTVLIQGSLENQQNSFEEFTDDNSDTQTNLTSSNTPLSTSPFCSFVESTNGSQTTTLDSAPVIGTYIILGNIFLRNYYTVFDADNNVVSFAKVVHAPAGLISAFQVIYIAFGAFIVVIFIIFIGCFIGLLTTNKTPLAENRPQEKMMVERKTTLSQYVQGFEAN